MKDIVQLREEVDVIDKEILELLAERLELAKKIVEKKQGAGLSIVDRKREEQLKEIWRIRAKELGLRTNPILTILKEVLDMSKETQRKVIDEFHE